jgi:uncharacterized protein with HEPN domain
MRADADRLLDILDALDAIRRRVGPDRAAFDTDELLRVWALHHLFIIGEASARVSEELRAKYPDVPWRQIVGMRNVIAHGYFDVDWDEVWEVVARDAASLRRAIEHVLATEGWAVSQSR